MRIIFEIKLLDIKKVFTFFRGKVTVTNDNVQQIFGYEKIKNKGYVSFANFGELIPLVNSVFTDLVSIFQKGSLDFSILATQR